jgi:hypothetical protein
VAQQEPERQAQNENENMNEGATGSQENEENQISEEINGESATQGT